MVEAATITGPVKALLMFSKVARRGLDGHGSIEHTLLTTVRRRREIGGADNVFHPAIAIVDGDTVTLNSPLVKEPKNVRYGWLNNPSLSLYNAAGLPAPPFTTQPQP